MDRHGQVPGGPDFSVPVRQEKRVLPHRMTETARGFEKRAYAVGSDHLLRQETRLTRFSPLAGTDEANQPHLVGA